MSDPAQLILGGVAAFVFNGPLPGTIGSSGQTVDLQPLLEALDGLKQQGSEILYTMKNPTRTAGDELLRESRHRLPERLV